MKQRVLLLLLSGAVIAVVILVPMLKSRVAYRNNPKPHSLPFLPAVGLTVKHKTNYHRLRTLPLLENSLKKMGYSVTDLPPWSALWTHKVHLCIMFNQNGVKATKEVIDILVSYYHPFFEDITLIYGAMGDKRPGFVPEFINFITCDSHIGWYQQKCIRLCMQRGNKESKGYMYVADDMFINITMMANLSTSKLWFNIMEPHAYSWIQDPSPGHWNWMWWGAPFWNSRKLKKIIDAMPSEWMEQLKRTAGFPDKFLIVSTSDMIYVPQILRPNMTKAIDFITSTTDLFGEIATCLAVDIAAPNQVIILEYGYLWTAKEKSIEGIKNVARKAHFVHPIKLGYEPQRKLWIEYMEKQLFNIIKAYQTSQQSSGS